MIIFINILSFFTAVISSSPAEWSCHLKEVCWGNWRSDYTQRNTKGLEGVDISGNGKFGWEDKATNDFWATESWPVPDECKNLCAERNDCHGVSWHGNPYFGTTQCVMCTGDDHSLSGPVHSRWQYCKKPGASLRDRTPTSQIYEYVGCYTYMKSSGWTRQTNTDVPITAEGVQTCREICDGAGFEYFGFECPHANGNEVHCECSNSINSNEKVDDQMCQEFNVNSGSHCTGPFAVETSFGTYYMGAGSINSGYKVAETSAPTRTPTSAPTRTPTSSPTRTPTSSPTRTPTINPTSSPTRTPTSSPTLSPSSNPSMAPTLSPSPMPTAKEFMMKIKGLHGSPESSLARIVFAQERAEVKKIDFDEETIKTAQD